MDFDMLITESGTLSIDPSGCAAASARSPTSPSSDPVTLGILDDLSSQFRMNLVFIDAMIMQKTEITPETREVLKEYTDRLFNAMLEFEDLGDPQVFVSLAREDTTPDISTHPLVAGVLRFFVLASQLGQLGVKSLMYADKEIHLLEMLRGHYVELASALNRGPPDRHVPIKIVDSAAKVQELVKNADAEHLNENFTQHIMLARRELHFIYWLVNKPAEWTELVDHARTMHRSLQLNESNESMPWRPIVDELSNLATLLLQMCHQCELPPNGAQTLRIRKAIRAVRLCLPSLFPDSLL